MGTGKSKEETVKEKAREWQRQIRGESRRIDRDVSRMRQEEEKLKKEIKTMAEKGQAASVKTLARQVVRSRKAVARLERRTKCSMSAVNLHLTTAVASMSTASALKMSSGVMKEMNRPTEAVPQICFEHEEMRQEMMRAEIADEMMEEGGFQESDDETEIDSAVARVYEEVRSQNCTHHNDSDMKGRQGQLCCIVVIISQRRCPTEDHGRVEDCPLHCIVQPKASYIFTSQVQDLQCIRL
eukprot:Skav226510  [mRNA]  locus=scaffold1773:45156:49147:- [translate_table: standard]